MFSLSKIIGAIFFSIIVVIFFIYSLLTVVVPRYLVVPPNNWKDKVSKALVAEKPIYIPTTAKKSSYRRRLILASSNPSYYTNFVNDKLKIDPEDKANPKDFMKKMTIRDPNDSKRAKIFGFFHPFANAAGGGERVLWAAVQSTLDTDPKNIVAIYTGDVTVAPNVIIENVTKKFQISLNKERIVFIYLSKRHLIDPLYWPHFTLLGQAIGSLLLTFEAICKLSPDIWIDTVGLPFSYPLISFVLKIPILSYVHYPIIQQNMLNKLKFNKLGDIVKISTINDFKIFGKFIYWKIFMFIYTWVGSLVDLTLTNSTWTFNHIENIWFFNSRISIVYPPCGTESIIENTVRLPPNKRENSILCIAQFRPEKRHDLIIKEYSKFYIQAIKDQTQLSKIPKLILLGSIRSKGDSETVETLRELVKTLEIPEAKVEFILDAKYELMLEKLSTCKYGINAMWNEHFGISVVEYMASGLIPLVHASAGPLYDIVVPWDLSNDKESDSNDFKSGFFFKCIEDPDFKDQVQFSQVEKNDLKDLKELEFVNPTNEKLEKYPTLSELFANILTIEENEFDEISKRGERIVLSKFSNSEFMKQWESYCKELVQLEIYKRDNRNKVEKFY